MKLTLKEYVTRLYRAVLASVRLSLVTLLFGGLAAVLFTSIMCVGLLFAAFLIIATPISILVNGTPIPVKWGDHEINTFDDLKKYWQ